MRLRRWGHQPHPAGRGVEVISTDLVDRGYGRGGHDFLADHVTLADHIITNPPYGPARGLAAKFVEHALTRIRSGGTVCMLLRTNWEAPQAHQHLMARCARKYTFSRRLEMHRGGYTGKKHSPQLDVSWYVFSNEHAGPTQTKVLPPDCGDEVALFNSPIAPLPVPRGRAMRGLQLLTTVERLAEPRGAKITILGRPGVGKTYLLRSLSSQTLIETLFLDAEAGDLCVASLAIASIRPEAWPDFRDVACALGGPNAALAPSAAYSEAHYQKVMANADLAGLTAFKTLFVNSLSEASRRCRVWAEQQPEAFSDRGRKDLRAVYGLVAREMIGWLQQLQHMRSRNVILVAVLEKVVDNYNVVTWRPQIEGQRTGNVMPAIVDEVLSLEWLDFGDHKPVRAFVTQEPNPWGLPGKDRSGKLAMVEPPDLGALLIKLSSPALTKGETS